MEEGLGVRRKRREGEKVKGREGKVVWRENSERDKMEGG